MKKQWCTPAKHNAEFVVHMEDILEVYVLTYDKNIPLTCMNEKPLQLLDEKLKPIPMKSGKSCKQYCEYVRKEMCSIFVFTEPLSSWRHVYASERRTRIDWANHIEKLLEVYYPHAEKVRLVMDNLNTHMIGLLYEAFAPEKALRLAKHLGIHYTPKHGSWLNIEEIELNAMTLQCLGRRIPTIETFDLELADWESRRNLLSKCVDWQFSTSQARTKLKSLYPNL